MNTLSRSFTNIRRHHAHTHDTHTDTNVMMNSCRGIRSPANPFPLPAEGILLMGKHGFEKSLSRGLRPKFAESWFSRAMSASEDVIESMVRDFMSHNLLDENAEDFQEVREFVGTLRDKLSFLPSPEQLTRDHVHDILVRYVHDSTFVSCVDHIQTSYDLGYFRSAFRIRHPFSAVRPDLAKKKLFRRVDAFQRIVFREVFTASSNTVSLGDISYDLRLGINVGIFKQNLKALEAQYQDLFPLRDIPCFIHI